MCVLQFAFLLAVAASGALAGPTSYQQQQQTSDLVTCEIYEDCVGPLLCVNGQIDVGGGGYIDLRTQPGARVRCSSPDVCCRKPKIPAPHPYCPDAGTTCVSDTSCNADGTFNPEGYGDSGIAEYPLTTCDLEGTTVGVCCDTPVVDYCPVGSVCLADGCSGDALNANNEFVPYEPEFGSWTRCLLESGSYGTCCQPKIPYYDVCPDKGVCVPGDQCLDGEAYDYTSSWIPYSPDYLFYSTCSFGGSPGICCKPKAQNLKTCPGGSLCLSRAECDGQAHNHQGTWDPYAQDYAYWTTCPRGDGTPGICCQPRVKDYEVCPDYSLCVPAGQCPGHGYTFLGQWTPYSPDYLYWSTCREGAGVCCKPDVPNLESCPSNSVCVAGAQCNGKAYDYTETWSPYSPDYRYWSTCSLGGGASGVCCQPEVINYETCPEESICVSPALCKGKAYDFTNSWTQYSSSNRFWGTCPLGQGASGICCKPDIPLVDPCPSGSVCVPGDQCIGESYDYLNNLHPYTKNYRYWSHCPTPLSSDGIGHCCKLPIASTCGIRNAPRPHPHGLGTRIQSPALADNDAQFGEFPWQGILFYSNYTFQCGATLVTDRHVLTAAHCVDGFYAADFRIRLGEWQVNTFDELIAYYDAEIARIVIHPDFKPGPVYNDVAVIELTKPVPFSYHINIVCLADASYYKKFDGARCITTGWGKDAFYGDYQHILKRIELPMVPHGACEALLKKTRLSEYFILDKSFMCAGGEENRDACKGDGGGPLVCPDEKGKYHLVGITAWGVGCGKKDVPGVYVDVSQVYNFISDVLEGRPVKETYYPGQSQATVDQSQQQVASYGK